MFRIIRKSQLNMLCIYYCVVTSIVVKLWAVPRGRNELLVWLCHCLYLDRNWYFFAYFLISSISMCIVFIRRRIYMTRYINLYRKLRK